MGRRVPLLATLVLAAYFGTLAILAGASAHRLLLAVRSFRARGRRLSPIAPVAEAHWPRVVVQLPLYNERFVAERAIDAAAALGYPHDRLEIQVLDDSTDETVAIVARAVARWAGEGITIRHLRRPDRVGFKAGALAQGLAATSAELVAIFDADFSPSPSFLRAAVATLLSDPGLGLVQARWAHANAAASWLTRVQALLLEAHFRIEHRGRDLAGHAFNFNGTAGVWRRQAIEDAGGWSADTLTEDLDLSYRAQLAGWRFVYRDDLEVQSELPESWSAFRAQQSRWVRGGVQTARKLLPAILRAQAWSVPKRVEALLHLIGNSAYLWLALLGLLLPAAVVLRHELGPSVPGGAYTLALFDVASLGAGTLAITVFYGCASWLSARRLALPAIALALAVGAGLSIHNGLEALRALGGARLPFIRTPKRGAAELGLALRAYRAPLPPWSIVLELLGAMLHAATIAYALVVGSFGAVPFLALYLIGFAFTAGASLREAWSLRPRAHPALPLITSDRRGG